MTRAPDSSRWISVFLAAKAAELGAAPNTLLAYERDLNEAGTWFSDNGSRFADADRGAIEGYLIHCDTMGLSKSTRARRLSAIKQLYRFAFEEGWRADNPALQIKGPGRNKRLPKTLSFEQVEGLLSAARGSGRNASDRSRNVCMIELLYATGMRVSELVGLPVSSARGDPRMILVMGKGGKERMVPLSEPARMALTDWLAIRDRAEELAVSEGKAASPFLFPSNSKLGHLTRHRFYLLIKELAGIAGIPPDSVSPHTMRHAFATHLLANGADLRSIQTLLGHADVGTTEIYTHVLHERLSELVLNHHPLAKEDGQNDS